LAVSRCSSRYEADEYSVKVAFSIFQSKEEICSTEKTFISDEDYNSHWTFEEYFLTFLMYSDYVANLGGYATRPFAELEN
jgi:hypothetical protein